MKNKIRIYHNTLDVIAIIIGIVMTFVHYYHDLNGSIAMTIIASIFTISLCTIAFLLFPIFCIAIMTIIKYGTILIFPIGLLFILDGEILPFINYIIGFLISLWSYFNWKTSLKYKIWGLIDKDNKWF